MAKAKPRARTAAKKSPMTVGDLTKKISSLRATQVLYGLLLVAVFLLGYLFARVQSLENGGGSGNQAAAEQTGTGAEPMPGDEVVQVANGHLPIKGQENAQVTLVEFSDFECPFCKRYYDDSYAQLVKDYVDTGKVKMYFRHYPLEFHPAANPAALASECANEQNLFWEFHDKAFNEQSRLSGGGEAANTELKAMAAEIGANSAQFDQCFDSAKYQSQVDEDVADGQAAGVSGTPTIFINGRKIVGAYPYETFKTIIEEELN